ncbi:MAG: N-acetyl-gamma-glutamyl-phosphate reductase [Clostridia bacterium]|nr:N-acetyl-gamma-glutamyl-phosphate reductase [Clostridia bacterium]
MYTVFIDGSSGTTGLRIRERLSSRADIKLISITDDLRRDTSARAQAINDADIVFLCLPDDAARESASLVKNPAVRVIDASTAHRTDEAWTYGFPEIRAQREKIAASKRVANPGCHASGFIALVRPLTELGVISPDAHMACFSLTGYSGGGKKMIAEYEQADRSALLSAPRAYALDQNHKHLPEMKKYGGLSEAPVFMPVVGPFYAGMEVCVMLAGVDKTEAEQAYEAYYASGLIRFSRNADENGFASACAFAGRDDLEVSVHGNGERLALIARFDNLGKGASGAAIQNMNLMLGMDEITGLVTA